MAVAQNQEEEGCFYHNFNLFTEEFHYKKLSLAHERAEDFYESHWQQKDSKSTLWLVYRWLLTGFFTITLACDVTLNFRHGKWFIYFTDWGYMLCVITSFIGAWLVSVHRCSPNFIKPDSSILKIYWASHFTCLISCVFIFVIYWYFLFPVGKTEAFDLVNFQTHALNPILMVLDHMLVAFPTHILHCVYPIMLIIIFCGFTAIYQFSGGLNINNKPYVYEILDWKYTTFAGSVLIGFIFLMLALTIIIYGLYRIRCAINPSQR